MVKVISTLTIQEHLLILMVKNMKESGKTIRKRDKVNYQLILGVNKFVNKDKYDGEWKDNKQEGEGTMEYNNGDKYEGDWICNERSGKGKRISKVK